ncbi:hypothetical protein J6590_104390, partial [Homalodisca vitripennis]
VSGIGITVVTLWSPVETTATAYDVTLAQWHLERLAGHYIRRSTSHEVAIFIQDESETHKSDLYLLITFGGGGVFYKAPVVTRAPYARKKVSRTYQTRKARHSVGSSQLFPVLVYFESGCSYASCLKFPFGFLNPPLCGLPGCEALSTSEWFPRFGHLTAQLLILESLRSKSLDFGSELEITHVQILSVTIALFISTIDLVLYRLSPLFCLIRSSHRPVRADRIRLKRGSASPLYIF